MRLRDLVDALRVTPPVALLYGLTSVIAVVGSFSRDDIAPLPLFALALVVSAIAVVTALVADAGVVRVRMPAPMGFLLAVVLAGIIRALALDAGLRLLGVTDRPGAGALLLTSVVSILVWMSLIGLFESSRSLYRRRYAALVIQASAAVAALDPGLDEHPDVVRLKSTLSAFGSTANPTDMASTIRREIEESLRPLGHRIWFSGQDAQPHARLGGLLRDALVAFPVPIAPLTTVWFVGGISGGVAMFGVTRGLLSAVLSSAFLVLALLVVRTFVRPTRPLTGVAGLLISSIAPIVLTDLTLHAFGFPATAGSLVSVFLILALGTMILGSAAVSLAASDRQVILRLVESRVADLEAQAHEGLRGTPTELAGFLHNSLQSELHGLALQLDEAGRLGDDAQARAALERVGAVAQRSLSEDFKSFRESPLQRLDRLSDAWEGIAVIDVQVECGPEDPRLSLAVRAVEELVANAIRHGSARRIQVQVRETVDRGLSVEIRSDGELSRATSGVGQGWLSSISQSGLEYCEDARGSGVRLEL